MTEVSFELPEIGELSSAADPRTLNGLIALKAWINSEGAVDENKLSAAVKSKLAAKATGLESHKSIIAKQETRENTAYGTLAVPDEVTVSLAEDGLIACAFYAQWKATNAGSVFAGLFLGGNQVVLGGPANVKEPVEVAIGGSTEFSHLTTGSYNLFSEANTGTAALNSTTGQVVGQAASSVGASTRHGPAGGPLYIFAQAGTYALSVKFKNETGVKVTVRNRKLWAWTIS